MKSNLNKIASSMLLVAGANLAHAGNVQIVMDVTKDQVLEICRNAELKKLKTVNNTELCEVSTDGGLSWVPFAIGGSISAVLLGTGYMIRRRKKSSIGPVDTPVEPEDDPTLPTPPSEPESMPYVDSPVDSPVSVPPVDLDINLGDDEVSLPVDNHTTTPTTLQMREFNGKNFTGALRGTEMLVQATSQGGKPYMQDYVDTHVLRDGKVVMIVLDGVSDGAPGETERFVDHIGKSLVNDSLQSIITRRESTFEGFYDVGTTAGKIVIENDSISFEKLGDIGIVILDKRGEVVSKNISGGFIPNEWFGSSDPLDRTEAENILNQIEQYGFQGKIDSTVPEYITTKGAFNVHCQAYTKQISPKIIDVDTIDQKQETLLDGDIVIVATDVVFDNMSIEHISRVLTGETSMVVGAEKILSELDAQYTTKIGDMGAYKPDNIGLALYRHTAKDNSTMTMENPSHKEISNLSSMSDIQVFDRFFQYSGNPDTDEVTLDKEIPNARKYIQAMRDIVSEYGFEELERVINKIREGFDYYFYQLYPNGNSPYAPQNAWIRWDIAKQYYLNKHPAESDPSKYRLANPMEDRAIMDEIVHRHLGWELLHIFPDGGSSETREMIMADNRIQDLLIMSDFDHCPSHVLTKIGYVSDHILSSMRA